MFLKIYKISLFKFMNSERTCNEHSYKLKRDIKLD